MVIRLLRPALAVLLASAVASCGGSPVSPEDRRLGAEQHPQLLAEFGGAYSIGDEEAYVRRVGQRMAGAAGLAGQCTFTLVNTDVVNAFAVPGCYIYITRGLLAIVNSEAELASVLGHEIGHIAAEHAERQQRGSLWRNLGVLAVATITGSEDLSRLASAAATYFSLRYSRSHEHEADDLGLKYLEEAGYDPFAAPDMLAALLRHEQLRQRLRGSDEASGIPEWALTHPLTQNRVRRTAGEARAAVGRRGTLPEGEAAYMRHVDGLLFGDDPEQGFVLGRRFAHPVMGIAFEAPPGVTLTNSPQAILIEGPGGLRGEFAGGPLPPGGLTAYGEALLAAAVGRAPVTVSTAVATRTRGGVPAVTLQGTVATASGPVVLSLAAYAGGGGMAYHFLTVSPPGAVPDEGIAALFGSFHLLSPAERAALRPRVIRVRTVRPGDSLSQLLAAMAAEHPLAEFLLINGRSPDQPLRIGEQVKLIAWLR